MVIPEREVPGFNANAWAAPTTTASRVRKFVDDAAAGHAVG